MIKTDKQVVTFGALALVGFLSGCGDEKPSGPGIPLETAPQEIAKSICPRAWECCTPMQLEKNEHAGTDEPSCEVKTRDLFAKNLSNVASAEKKGRLKYRGDKLEACLNKVRAASCEELNRVNRLSLVCDEPWVEPLVAVGGVCGSDTECIASYCDKEPMAWEGVCRTFAQESQACSDRQRCSAGMICREDMGTCLTPRAENEACSLDAECASAKCSAPAGGMGRCTAPAAPGPQCFYGSGCSLAGGATPTTGTLLAMLILVGSLVRRRRR